MPFWICPDVADAQDKEAEEKEDKECGLRDHGFLTSGVLFSPGWHEGFRRYRLTAPELGLLFFMIYPRTVTAFAQQQQQQQRQQQ